MAQWRRGNIDFRMGSVLIVGGVAGALIGVALLKILREAGQAGLIISLTYVVLLGVIGSLMLNESIGAIRRARAGKPASGRKPGQHNWIHGMPLKLRFTRSRLYISAIPPLLIGWSSACCGLSRRRRRLHHGAGHDLSVAHADQCRDRHLDVPDHLRHRGRHGAACEFNHTLDVVLALILAAGGVIGGQFGVAPDRNSGPSSCGPCWPSWCSRSRSGFCSISC